MNEILLKKIKNYARITPDSLAIFSPDREPVDYKTLFEILQKIKTKLSRYVRPGSVAAMIIEDPSLCLSVTLAASSFCRIAPLAIQLTHTEVNQSVTRLKASYLITDRALSQAVISELNKSGVTIIFLVPGRQCCEFETMQCTSEKGISRESDKNQTGWILQTTGSTAVSKLVPIQLKAVSDTCNGSSSSLKLSHNDRCLCFMPLNHIHGLISNAVLPLTAGGSTVLVKTFSKSGFISWMLEYQPTWFSTTPFFYKEILSIPNLKEHVLDHHKLRFIRIGSAPMESSFGHTLEKSFGVPLIEAYGMTETLQITGNPIDKRRIGSVGCSIAPKIAIMNERHEQLPVFSTGSIAVKGDSIFKNYINNHEADDVSFHKGWFYTGDIGWLDTDGYLYLAGRASEFINKGGEKISPNEIESVLKSISGVKDAVVWGEKHPSLGEDIAAAIELTQINGLNKKDIKKELYHKVSAFKHPSVIHFVDVFPRTANGKIIRKEIAVVCARQAEQKRQPKQCKPESVIEKYVFDKFFHSLGLESFGIDDDFFSLGGNSLSFVEMLSSIEKDLDEMIHVPLFITDPCVRSFADKIEKHYPDHPFFIRFGRKKKIDPKISKISISDCDAFEAALPSFHPQVSFKQKISPFFILSAPRSGSTLQRVILAGHPDLFVPPELRLMLFKNMQEWKRALSGPYSIFQDGLIGAVMSAMAYDSMQATDWVDEQVRKNVSVPEVYRALCKAVSPRILIDKTPYYALFPDVLNYIEDAFYEPGYLHLIRNPAAMVESFTKNHMDQLWMYDHSYKGPELAQLVWYQSNQTIIKHLSKIGGTRSHTVFFEDLVQKPHHTTKRICRFLGLNFKPKMMNVYDHDENRMTDSPQKKSYMIGDRKFFQHKKINAKIAGSGFYLPDNQMLSPVVRDVALFFGYHQTKEKAFNEKKKNVISTVIHNIAVSLGHKNNKKSGQREKEMKSFSDMIDLQRSLFRDWDGIPHGDGLIKGFNLHGSNPPIFWCFTGKLHSRRLARLLGPDQPLYAMRSGTLLFKKDDSFLNQLAEYYSCQIQEINSQDPIIIGGTCQGGIIAWEIVKHLKKSNRFIPLLCLLDVNINKPYDGSIALFYAQESQKYNPFLFKENSKIEWGKNYKHYSLDLVKGEHGQFYKKENVADLSSKLKKRLDDMMTAMRDSHQI